MKTTINSGFKGKGEGHQTNTRGGPLWFSWTEKSSSLGQDALAHIWPDLLLYGFHPTPLILCQTVNRILQGHHRMHLVAPNCPWRLWFPVICRLLNGEPWSLPRRPDLLLQLQRQIWHPSPDEEPEVLLRSCDLKVQNTILNSRAPSTRNIYVCRWKLFNDRCTPRGLVPEHCPVPMVLCKAPSTLKIYVAADICTACKGKLSTIRVPYSNHSLRYSAIAH